MRYLFAVLCCLFFGAVAEAGLKRNPPVACVPPVAVVPAVIVVESTTRTYRQPHGHTHTCANGHTWDHDSNPTHTCKVCGLSQFTVDPVPRPVLVVEPRPVVVSEPIPLTYTFPQVSGGCVGGNCPAPTRTPLLPWRRER